MKLCTVRGRGFTLVELLVVVVILAVLIAVLLPMLSRARKAVVEREMANDYAPSGNLPMSPLAGPEPMTQPTADGQWQAPPPPPALAHVSTFEADITLTPRLSVGTAEPESIYEAAFAAKLSATAPGGFRGSGGAGGGADMAVCRIELPLPPEIISLADLTVTVDGEPSDAISMEQDKLVWQGKLNTQLPSQFDITYAAVGRGLYSLQTPPGKVIDHFKIKLTAAGSDVRMLELSMQPTELHRDGGQTIYTWDYKKLMFGRPIAVDVLGIAPIDRLGELSWLGPLSLIAFGLVVGLVTHAAGMATFDRWVLLLLLGTFTGAYPLMYFAQEFISLNAAIGIAGGLVLLVIGLRAMTIMGVKLGFIGVMLPAGVIMAVTLAAALKPNLQGILLTGMVMALFVLGMSLAPKLKWPEPRTAPPVPAA